MKRLVLVITTVLVLISSRAFAQSNPNEEQQNQLVENLAEKLYGLAEAQLNAIQSIIEDQSYYNYQEPTLTPGEEIIPNGDISMPDGVHVVYCRHLNDFCIIEIEQGSIEVTHDGEVLYQGWIVDKHCVGLDDGFMYLKITFLNGTYYEKLYINYLVEDTDSEEIVRTYSGQPVYYMK